MREIKFRGIDARSGEWIFGSLVQEDGKAWILPFKLTKGIPTQLEEVRPETVGQYIGFKDKSGKEIYEMDIVRQRFNGQEETGVVSIDSPRGMMVGDRPIWLHNAEIIGNVHENPDLLK